MCREYGYIRVSSVDQNEGRQVTAMKRLGIPPKRIFVDKQSGKDFQRPQYQAMLKKLKSGDLLHVASIDRLGRDYEEIQAQWRMLTRVKGIDINVLDMPLLDTRREKNLLGAFISDLVLQILSYVAQVERENISKRQAEGIAAAKARGVRFGRRPNLLPENFPEIYLLWKQKNITVTQAAALLGMSRTTFYRKARRGMEGQVSI